MRRIITGSLGTVLLLAMMTATGCDKDAPTALSGDRQIRLPILSISLAWPYTSWSDATVEPMLLKFDKRNYPGADSAIWVASLSTTTPGAPVRIRLYNVTDSAAIAGSDLISYSGQPMLIQSANIFKSFPDHEITLGFQLRSDSIGAYVMCNAAELYLYRR